MSNKNKRSKKKTADNGIWDINITTISDPHSMKEGDYLNTEAEHTAQMYMMTSGKYSHEETKNFIKLSMEKGKQRVRNVLAGVDITENGNKEFIYFPGSTS